MLAETKQIEQFSRALRGGAERYDVELSAEQITRLSNYYALLLVWNPRLHLVAPCSAAEFATRHVLESLLLITHLTANARVADVGSGAGLPIIPALITRPDIHAELIESSQKKAVFLREALQVAGTATRARVLAERFENVPSLEIDYVTCRALDRFSEMLPRLIEWAPPSCVLLLFGGIDLERQIKEAGLKYSAARIPDSERRFLFVAQRPG
jgi:16S rRNA (guanine527-N7)-methyltransferase